MQDGEWLDEWLALPPPWGGADERQPFFSYPTYLGRCVSPPREGPLLAWDRHDVARHGSGVDGYH